MKDFKSWDSGICSLLAIQRALKREVDQYLSTYFTINPCPAQKFGAVMLFHRSAQMHGSLLLIAPWAYLSGFDSDNIFASVVNYADSDCLHNFSSIGKANFNSLLPGQELFISFPVVEWTYQLRTSALDNFTKGMPINTDEARISSRRIHTNMTVSVANFEKYIVAKKTILQLDSDVMVMLKLQR